MPSACPKCGSVEIAEKSHGNDLFYECRECGFIFEDVTQLLPIYYRHACGYRGM